MAPAGKFEKKMDALTDPKNGWKYIEKVPDGWRLATLDDFHQNGRRRIGMQFIIKWIIRENYYQVCQVSENLKSDHLKKFIDAGRVYVSEKNHNHESAY
jgi:hypothetical protein